MYTDRQLQKLFNVANMVPVRIPKGSAGGTARLKINGADITATYLTNLEAGEAIALLTDKGNWYLIGKASNTENASNRRIIEYRKTQPITVSRQANIKILFSEVQDGDRLFYVLDEKRKSNVLTITSTINENFIQGNLFNYGGKNKYTSSIQYIGSLKLNALNIVNGDSFPLWDTEQIYSSNNIPYLGTSILSSFYFNVPYIEGENTTSTTYSGGQTTPGTIREIVSNTILNIAIPSTYFSLSGADLLNSLAQYQNDNGTGEPGYSTYYQITGLNVDINSKSFYLNKSLASSNAFAIHQQNTSLYNATLADAGFSAASTVINQSTTTTGFVYLGDYVPNTVSNSFSQSNGTVINTQQTLISGSIVTTSNISTNTNSLNTNLLLVQGIGSDITSNINYNRVTVTNLLTSASTVTTIDETNYYLYSSTNPEIEPIILNKNPSVIIEGFTTKITDTSTTTIVANVSTSLNLTEYIGESILYGQLINANSSWLAVGSITSFTSVTVTITLSEISTTNFVSFATTNGRAISNNGSLFSLLGLFSSDVVLDKYILLSGYSTDLTSFAELLKYGCLIGKKFYICQNNEAIKTSKTNLYVEQWDIADDGNITRNNKLIKVPVNSLGSPGSKIHSIQYWNKN